MTEETTLSGPTSRHRPRATIRDVAALAGVSLKTVSRVINGETGVSPELTARVRDAAQRLDFRPNLGARSLRRSGGKTATIGLLLEDVSNPFSAAIHRNIENVARSRGVAVFTASVDEDPEREQALVSAFVARRVDGLIMVPAGGDQSYLHNEARAGLSLVFLDRPPAYLDADVVLAANEPGAENAVRHLLAGGHRRIAYLGDLLSISTARERYAGYGAALRAAGIPIDPVLVWHDLHSSDLAGAAASELLSQDDPPTAIFASQNLVTIGVIRALRAAGRQHDIALVGFDEVPLADLLEPGVTVVAQDVGEIGRGAAEQLFRRLDGDRSPTVRRVVPTRLIRRGSGEIAPRR
jgi:LacI family transcriptional regulator